MRSLREDERDEVESLGHLVKHVISKKDVDEALVYHAVLQYDEIMKKYLQTKIVSEEELNELLDIDDFRQLMDMFLKNILTKVIELDDILKA